MDGIRESSPLDLGAARHDSLITGHGWRDDILRGGLGGTDRGPEMANTQHRSLRRSHYQACTGSHSLFGSYTVPVQVCLQSCLIYIAGKLRVQGDPELRNSQPGKQAVTFLLLANIGLPQAIAVEIYVMIAAMFLMNLLESEKAGVCKSVVEFYGKKNWVFLVRSFSPLTIFYRFHSSVCLAEVWKNAYSWKG